MVRRPGRGSEFDEFVVTVEPRLRRARVAAYGPEGGRAATLDALAWAWRHWSSVADMGNPTGYLYRVGQSHARRTIGRRRLVRSERQNPVPDPWIEPSLVPALEQLTEHQRIAVVLCHGMQWTHREVAELLDLSPSTVQNHVERGLATLRRLMKVTTDV